MTRTFTVPEADRTRIGALTPWKMEPLDLVSGPRALPRWAKGGHIDWHWPFSNRPSYMVRCKTDPLAFTTDGAPVWRRTTYNDGAKTGVAWIAERDGVASCHYHSGIVSMVEFEEHVRWIEKPSQANGWKGQEETRKFFMLATTQQDGYAGRHFDITLMAQEIPVYDPATRQTTVTKVDHGTKLRLRGPWHGGAPAGYVETSYWIDNDKAWRPKGRKWFESGGYFGLLIKPEILLDILATFQPHVQWAMVTETLSGKDRYRPEPLVPETGLPKGWHIHPDQCPRHDFVQSPWATGRDRTQPNDRCRFCNQQRRPGWVFLSSVTGKPIASAKKEDPFYFDRFLEPKPPRKAAPPARWPTDVHVPLRQIGEVA
jgi:hypothetical protein